MDQLHQQKWHLSICLCNAQTLAFEPHFAAHFCTQTIRNQVSGESPFNLSILSRQLVRASPEWQL